MKNAAFCGRNAAFGITRIYYIFRIEITRDGRAKAVVKSGLMKIALRNGIVRKGLATAHLQNSK